jgi:GT2 family glycosyltransferase
MAKKVSIITINYNGKDDTVDLIESFGRYETYPYEIIIIDNGSKTYFSQKLTTKSNGSVAQMLKHSSKFPRELSKT